MMAKGTTTISHVFSYMITNLHPSREEQLTSHGQIEYGFLFKSAILEIHLCILDHRFVRDIEDAS